MLDNYKLFRFFLLFIFSVFSTSVLSATGSEWLLNQSNVDGSFTSFSPQATDYQATAEVIRALSKVDSTNTLIPPALTYLSLDSFQDTEYLSRKIIAHAAMGNSVATLLEQLRGHQNQDGGFGDFVNHQSTVIATAYGLEAFIKSGALMDPSSEQALIYLLDNQNSDGGWDNGNNETSIYLTSIILTLITEYRYIYTVSAEIEQARTYLLGNVAVAGNVGEDFETALALIALAPVVSDRISIQNIADYLQITQLANGSWSDDAYTTALAMRAFFVFSNVVVPDTTKGVISGVITDGVSGLPLSGATIIITGAQTYTATTDIDGRYIITDVLPGDVSYSVMLVGYLTGYASGTVVANKILNFDSQLPRDPQPVAITLTGTVVDDLASTLLSGTSISVINSGLSTVTGADGTFVLNNITAGTISVRIIMAGYVDSLFSISAPAGGIVDMGVVRMNVIDPVATTGSLSGNIVDSLTASPLRGVAVSLSGVDNRVVYTDLNGYYSIPDIQPGNILISASYDGYLTANASGVVAAGSVLNFSARLVSNANIALVSISGSVIDDSDGQPIVGAYIDIPGAGYNILTSAGGVFQIGGIPSGAYEVSISFAGYNTVTYAFTAPNGGFADFGDIRLARDIPVDSNTYPEITSEIPLSVSVGFNYLYQLAANDPDGDTLTYGLEQYPSGMTIDSSTGLVTWIPTLNQVGQYEIKLLVSDGNGGVIRQVATVIVSAGSGNAYVLTDVQTLNGLSINTVVPQNYVLGSYVSGGTPGIVSGSLPCSVSGYPTGSDVSGAAVSLDRLAFQASPDNDAILDLGISRNTVSVFPQLDQAPLPQEGIEYTVWGSNDPNALFPDEWQPGTLVSIYVKGWEDDLACTGTDSDDYAGLYTFGQNTYRYVRVRANYSITLFDTPKYEIWSSVGDDSGVAGWQSVNAEIDAVGGMLCDTSPVANAGTNILGVTRQAIQFDASASQGDIQVYAWDIDSDGTIDTTGINPQWTFTAGFDKDATLYVVDAQGCVGVDTVNVIVDLEYPKPDLSVNSVNTSGVFTDLTTLNITGTVRANIVNQGLVSVVDLPLISAFADIDRNGQYDAANDVLFGSISLPAGLARGEENTVNIPVNGASLYRDAAIYVMVDSNFLITESDETNNIDSSASACYFEPIVIGTVDPVQKWHWNTEKVMTIPLVAPLRDTNGDGAIDELDDTAVIFASHPGFVDNSRAHLRAVDGKTGTEIWSILDAALNTEGSAHPAVGDIDGDGVPEIVMYLHAGGIAVINNDGSLKWTSSLPPRQSNYNYGSITLADLDGDGQVEILARNHVLNSDGSLRWSVPDIFHAITAIAVDLNMDGVQEVLIGARAYTESGADYYADNAGRIGAFTAVGNFDSDDFPEIVISNNSTVYLYESTGELIWEKAIPGGGGGPPTIADMDGDGLPEIGVAGSSYYVVFNDNGSILWQSRTQDYSSRVTGSTVFDFDGDGTAEVIYGDERMLRVYNGRNGNTIYSIPNGSWTATEYPVVADIDSDGHAELLVVGDRAPIGLKVFEDANDSWMPTRKIWNQYAYHIDNVNDDTSIPAQVVPSWLTHNTFRLNAFPDRTPGASIDLTASLLKIIDNGATQPATLVVRIGNGGTSSLTADTLVSFYEGDPTNGGQLIASITIIDILPNGYQDVELTGVSSLSGAADIYAIVDSDNRISECSEANNKVMLPVLPQTNVGNIAVATDRIVYNPGATVSLQGAVTNTSAVAGEFKATLQVEDLNGGIMFTINPTVSNPVPGRATTNVSSTWNSTGILAGTYRLHGSLYSIDGNIIAEDITEFQLQHPDVSGPAASLRVLTDSPIYHTSDRVLIDDLVNNLTTTTLIGNADIELVVQDPAGLTVFETILSLGQLSPGAQRKINTDMPLSSAPIGTYTITGVLLDQQRSVILDTSVATFVVEENPLRSISGDIQAGIPVIIRGQSQSCVSSISNTGISTVTTLPLRVVLANLDTQDEISRQGFVLDLPVGTETNNITTHSGSDFQIAGFYACILQAELDGVWQTLAQAIFEVDEPSILIESTLQSVGHGRLLVLIDNVGSVSGCAAPFELGMELPLVTTTNESTTVKVKLFNSSGVMIDEENIVLADKFPFNSNLPVGDIDLTVINFSANSLRLQIANVNKMPLMSGGHIETTVNTAGVISNYNSGVINFDCYIPLNIGSTIASYRISSVLLAKEFNTSDPRGPIAAPSTERQQKYLDDVLTAAGWSYTLVTDASMFARELRSGMYSSYAILSENIKIDIHVQEELREAIFRGEGLLLAGSYDELNYIVFDALGVKLESALPNANGITFNDPTTGQLTSIPFAYADEPNKIFLNGAIQKGGFTQTSPSGDIPHPDNTGSITMHQYGSGKTIFVGFDLLAHGAAGTPENEFGTLLIQLLDKVSPQVVEPLAHRAIPVELKLNNWGVAIPGRVDINLSAGVIIDGASSTRISDTQLQWTFDLAQSDTQSMRFWSTLPANALDTQINASVATGIAPGLVAYRDVNMTINILPITSINEVINTLTALSIRSNADPIYNLALRNLTKGRTSLESGDIYNALLKWLGATSKLATLNDPEADSVRKNIDYLIRELEVQL